MLKRTILGIDIGENSAKLALVSGTRVLKTAEISLPDRLVQNGHVVSGETMSELIREAMKKAGISCRHAACVLGGEDVFTGIFTVPLMTDEQLKVNLPYEFRDYITEDLKDYTYDYAVLSTNEAMTTGDEEHPTQSTGMKLMAVAAPTARVEETKDMIRKCGLKLERLAPGICALIDLYRLGGNDETTEYCVLDVGQESARLYFFRGSEFIVTRTIQSGISTVEEALSDSMGVDIHLAHSYLPGNYMDCVHSEACMQAFNSLALDIMRALNFYRFSNPDNHLEKLYICGGGAMIPSLLECIRDTVSLPVAPLEELLPDGVDQPAVFAQAVGITAG